MMFSLSCRVYLTRRRPERGDISLRNELPIWAAANGSLPWLNSSRRLKLTNMPCAVSGRKNLYILLESD